MAKKIIRTGTTADPTGDSLKNAFVKVNDNFTELYNALGLDADLLNLGAFEFTGSVMTTTDSSAIVIDQATTITSNLSVGGDILPQTANGGDLGSSTLPWRSLYVSNNTIYIGGTAVGIDANGKLTTGGTALTSDRLVNGAYTVSLGSNGNLEAPGIVSATGLRTSETKIALGSNAGQTSQGSNSVAVGAFAGQTSQGPLSVAIGYGAGAATQGTNSVAVGNLAGANTQGGLSVAVGSGAGQVNQGYEAVAVGFTTGLQDQGAWAVAIGSYAGAGSQGEDAIAIGRFAGQTNQPDNTIILNASGSAVDGVAAQTNSFYVAPIRNIGGTSGVLQYNAATKEVSYSSDITSEGNINIEVNLTDSTKYIWQFGEDGALTLPPGGTILTSSGLPFVYGITSINSSVAIGVYNDASGDYQYGTLSYDYAVNGITSGGFSIEYSRPLVGGNVDIHVGNTIVNGDLTLSGDIKSDGNINIEVNLTDSTKRIWQFGEDGSLTLPSVGKINNGEYDWTFGSNGNTTFPTGLVLGAPRGVNTVNFTSAIDKEFQIETQTASTGKLWRFETNGNTTLPSGLTFRKNGTPYSTITTDLDKVLQIETQTSGGVLQWSFGTDGSITFPNATVQTTAWAGIPGPYSDDSAAAAAGVAVGYPYHKTGFSGQVFVRLS